MATTEMFPIQEVDPIKLVFPASVKEMMPRYEDIPEEFRNLNRHNKWQQVQADWFYYGLKNDKWTPKEGVDTEKALKHLACIQSSWEPKREHKVAAVSYLMSQWFDDVTYERARERTGD